MKPARRTRNSMLLVVGLCLGSVSCLRACTVFSDSSEGTVLAGRNYDGIANAPAMWFVPAGKGVHGRVCFGRHVGDCQDGMNDQGLFVAVAAAPPSGRFRSSQMSVSHAAALDGMLASCATVDEAMAWLKKKPNVLINGSWTTYRFLGLFGKSYGNSGVGGHFLVADKTGRSVVCEWEKGKLKVIRKTGRYQLITNFLLSKPDAGGSPCPRFAAAKKVLDEVSQPSVAACAAALEATSGELTRYSVVYDLARGDAHVDCRSHFATPKTIHLSEELKKEAHEVNLYAWFGVNAVEIPREGKVEASTSIPGADQK